MNIDQILESQRTFFQSGDTISVDFRKKMLKKLYTAITKYENEIKYALKEDLGKSDYEAFMCEIGLTLTEITYMLRHITKFTKKHRVKTPLAQFHSVSFQKSSPYGNVLIMSPWNYPFLLTMEPLVDAIAAGNTVILKPSAYSPATSAIVKKIITECFPPNYVAVITGGRKENSELLEKKFDMIFFTGSQSVGKEVLLHAAPHLTPVVLELGGKSPCIIDESADIPLAAKRIVFGKFLNCGQTCVAPDYILCHSKVKEKLLKELTLQIQLQYGTEPLKYADYGHIINKKHFDRLLGLIDQKKIVIGGNYQENTLQIAPTILTDVTWEDSVMQEEIFGPILPILIYDDFESLYPMLANKPKPLAFYLFSSDKERIDQTLSRLSFGGGCINDVIIHLATSEMPFGGVGESGMGGYHGKTGFEAFSHTKSIVDKKTWLDLPMRYHPYKRNYYEKILRLFLR